MSDYIKREDAIHAKCDPCIFCEDGKDGEKHVKYPCAYYKRIMTVPAADVRENVRGEWVDYPEALSFDNAYCEDHIVCSRCKSVFNILDNDTERFDFCPCCGAWMKGGK